MGIPEMIHSLVAEIPGADDGFALYFSENPFPDFHVKLDWIREEYEGNWYRLDGSEQEGWDCPPLVKYLVEAPQNISIRAAGARTTNP